jgi:hypothetical protein
MMLSFIMKVSVFINKFSWFINKIYIKRLIFCFCSNDYVWIKHADLFVTMLNGNDLNYIWNLKWFSIYENIHEYVRNYKKYLLNIIEKFVIIFIKIIKK